MAATIINGKEIAARIKEEIRERVVRLKQRGITPCLAVILAGEDPASISYVKSKEKALVNLNMASRNVYLSGTVSQEELLSIIASLNADPDVHGILVQLPLPSGINEEVIMSAIDPSKDVDCFNPVSMGKLFRGSECFLPCTPQGIIMMLNEHKIPIAGSHVVVVGRSNIVGKPAAMLLLRKDLNATVTVCHTGTKDLASFTRQADILIVAAGVPSLIRGNMIKNGAAVIDVGVTREGGIDETYNRLDGDVEFREALEVAGWITPVPGGVGPMTIAMLMKNVTDAAEAKTDEK